MRRLTAAAIRCFSESAEAKPKAEKKTKTKPGAGDKKMSALDAAAKLLDETGQSMNCQDLIKGMADKGYWTSPGGKTPSATLYASILRELKIRGAGARFQKTERGKFALKAQGE